MQEAYITASDLLAEIEQIAALGTFSIDLLNGRWHCSVNFRKLFGLTEQETYDYQQLTEIIIPEEREKFPDPDDWAQNGDIYLRDFRCIFPDGGIKFIQCKGKVHRDAEGTARQVIGFFRDISERKENEAKLEHLIALNRAKNRMLAVVAHDLRSPIANMYSVCNLIKSKDSEPELIHAIDKSYELSQDLIKDLIQVAGDDDEDQGLEKEPVDVLELIEEVLRTCQARLLDKKLMINLSVSRNLKVLAHREKLIRVIDNLMTNAIKFSFENQMIELKAFEEEGSVVIKVRDFGVGMSSKEREHLFEIYSRYRRNGTKGEKSTGLGLYIVNQIVQAHRGTIEFDGAEGEGTVVTVRLPAN